MKKFSIFFVVLILGIGMSGILSGCGVDFHDDGEKPERIQSVEAPEFKCEYTNGLGYYVKISGALKNTGDSTYSYVSITFSLYDENGYNVGTAIDNMNYLGAGEIWKYEANSFTWFETPPVSYKCSDITYF